MVPVKFLLNLAFAQGVVFSLYTIDETKNSASEDGWLPEQRGGGGQFYKDEYRIREN